MSDPPQPRIYEIGTPPPPWCPRCRYDLRSLVNLSGARCPECGARLRFDQIRFPGQRRRWRLLPIVGAIVMVPLAAGVLVLMYMLMESAGRPGWHGPALVVKIAIATLALWWLTPELPLARRVFLAFSASLLLFFARWDAQALALLLLVTWLATVLMMPGRGRATTSSSCAGD